VVSDVRKERPERLPAHASALEAELLNLRSTIQVHEKHHEELKAAHTKNFEDYKSFMATKNEESQALNDARTADQKAFSKEKDEMNAKFFEVLLCGCHKRARRLAYEVLRRYEGHGRKESE
jgi:hypothetical protein